MEQRKPVSSEPDHPTRAEAGPQEVRTEAAPAPVGPYSQGIAAAGPFLFAAGQVGLDPKTGKLAGEDVASQTRQALLNLKAVLEAGGTSLANVVKTTVFLADMKDFAAMNAVYREFFCRRSGTGPLLRAGGWPALECLGGNRGGGLLPI